MMDGRMPAGARDSSQGGGLSIRGLDDRLFAMDGCLFVTPPAAPRASPSLAGMLLFLPTLQERRTPSACQRFFRS
jgi:hypothetical protein